MVESVDDFKLRYSEFKDLDHSLVEAMLNEAALSLDKMIYKHKYQAALFALCAHLLFNVLGVNGDLNGGSVSGAQQTVSEKAGELQVNYASRASTGNPMDDVFMNSVYGQNYLRLRDEVKPKVAVVHRGFQFS